MSLHLQFKYFGLSAVAMGLLLAGCASPPPPPVAPKAPTTFVVLLPSPDGTTGKVMVQGPKGAQVLTEAQQGAALDGSGSTFKVSDAQLKQDFGAAMSALPELPEHFMLYFQTGGSELTAESRQLLVKVLERVKARSALDVSVIGHTDTVGKPEANATLALQRANTIAAQVKSQSAAGLVLSVESHGESNLLVPTPDETAEPRNRRVEITLR